MEDYNNKKEFLSKYTIRGAIIPHAGKKYAGAARFSVFRLIRKSVKQIIYIAALHDINNSGETYVLHEDKGFPQTRKKFVKTSKKEHSFDWVYPELEEYFPNAKILAIAPNLRSVGLGEWIADFLKRHANSIVIATTDLTHYGPSFDNVKYLSYPQQMSKVKKEEKLIEALTQYPLNSQEVNNLLKNKHLTCGSKAIEVFVKAMSLLNYGGKVVDYYDSHSIKYRDSTEYSDKLDLYVVDTENVKHLVSYVSIIYGKKIRQNIIINFDIMLAIGLLKGIIKKQVSSKKQRELRLPKKQRELRLPIWSPFNEMKQGVFVGTSINGKTNCSYGRYENGESTATKIIEASDDCPKDAENRWRLPYNNETLDEMTYKVELLDPKNAWKTFKGNKAPKKFKLDGKHGMFLKLPNGRGATYLPVVVRDSDWTIEKYMESLTKKAGGSGDEWENGEIKIYKTRSFTWNPENQQLEIF